MDTVKILIVEHDEADIDFLKRQLRKGDIQYQPIIVQTEEEYRKELKQFKPDVILSDFNLPSFSGVRAFEIRQAERPDIPFIFVSGAIGEERAVELIKEGVTDYTLKDKLFSLEGKIVRALKEVEDEKQKLESERRILKQNERLFEIAHLQSHQVRKPIANILGLIRLLDFDGATSQENLVLLKQMDRVAHELDTIIKEIVEKTNEIDEL